MKAGDSVERKDKSLKLVVAVVDGDRFMAQGWPPALEDVADFEVIREATAEEETEALLSSVQIRGDHGDDWRAQVAKRQLRERRLLLRGPPAAGTVTVRLDLSKCDETVTPDRIKRIIVEYDNIGEGTAEWHDYVPFEIIKD